MSTGLRKRPQDWDHQTRNYTRRRNHAERNDATQKLSIGRGGHHIVESLLTSIDSSTVASATKKKLVNEPRTRGLPCFGRKDDLIERLVRDTSRRATAPTDT
ncbi:hypothetical protein HPB50_024982 [Hyalomma asiaticum]|uniref:Uncharacterized protein n=1 Tax=Hyalomma asiaticum TaxID=266040 RepID=A0ACB7TQT5_HYAAI|nr:hypothetical protein HPB50_024982 [Hyalomma asiaticum]